MYVGITRFIELFQLKAGEQSVRTASVTSLPGIGKRIISKEWHSPELGSD